MENKKIKFAVEDVSLVDENPDDTQFAVLKVDAFATGRSLHDTFVTEETLMRTSKSILLKPIVFAVDKILDDLRGHETYEVPGGFVPHNSPIEFRKLDDGRTMLSVKALVWKRYSGKLLDYFSRDGNKKKVSVEIEVTKSRKDSSSGLLELLDYSFNAITCLGDFITSAIPNAQAVLQFSKEFEDAKEDFEVNSMYDEIDFSIPEEVKTNVSVAMEKYQELHKMNNPVAYSNAKFLLDNEKINPERIRKIYKFFMNNDADVVIDEVTLGLWGGRISEIWSKEIFNKIDDIENKIVSYEYGKNENENEEKIFVKDNYLGLEEYKNMAKVKEDVAIEKEEMAAPAPAEKEEMAAPEKEAVPAEKEEMAAPEKEGVFAEEEKKDDEEKGEDSEGEESANMSLSGAFDIDSFFKLMKTETNKYQETKVKTAFYSILEKIAEEISKGQDAESKNIFNYMIERSEELSNKVDVLFAEKNSLISENQILKDYKSNTEIAKLAFEVDSVLREAEEVGMPDAELDAYRGEAKNFSLDNIDVFKNMVKAKAFVYAGSKKKEQDDIIRMSLPFSAPKPKTEKLWD